MDDKIKQMWDAGHSASQIASVLPGMRASLVYGRIRRLGIAGHSLHYTKCAQTHVVPETVISSLLALERGECRWPMGNRFCGEPCSRGRSYCPRHFRRSVKCAQ